MVGVKKIQMLDPKVLKVPEVRITSVFEDEIYGMFADDIQKEGIDQPLLVAKDGENLWVIDGKNRRDQALLQGITKVPCLIREMSLKDLQLRNLVLNRLRGKTKASEEVLVIKDLYETHHCGIEEIVERTGMRRERVEMLLQIAGVDHEVWDALDKEEVKVCHAFELSRLVDRSAQIKMLRVCQQYKLPCKDLKAAVDEAIKIIGQRAREEGKNPVVAPPSMPVASCSCCHEDYPVRELSAPILCRNCYALLIGSYNEAVAEYERQQKEAPVAAAEEIVEEQK